MRLIERKFRTLDSGKHRIKRNFNSFNQENQFTKKTFSIFLHKLTHSSVIFHLCTQTERTQQKQSSLLDTSVFPYFNFERAKPSTKRTNLPKKKKIKKTRCLRGQRPFNPALYTDAERLFLDISAMCIEKSKTEVAA